MGTPEFAVPSLRILIENEFNIVGVITAPDRPAGRGRKIQFSAVKTFAIEKGLTVLQPTNLKDPSFLIELKSLKPNLQVVVAFRMLPEVVWNLPDLGTFNLHASLLPQYRGAAPINWAIINGETKTGLTTFFLDKEIDTGRIIQQTEVEIAERETAGELHDRLMIIGSELVLNTAQAIEAGRVKAFDQSRFLDASAKLKIAPKLHKEDARINWNLPVIEIQNFIHGLSPFPGAFAILESPQHMQQTIKIFKSEAFDTSDNRTIGSIETDGKNYLNVFVKGGKLCIIEIQVAGKQRMNITDFLRGFQINDNWMFIL